MRHGPSRRDVLAAGAITLATPAQAQRMTADRARSIAEARFAGRVVGVDLDRGRGREANEIVYEIRMITPQGHVIRIRIDAATGAFVDVEGRGFLEAERR